MSAAEFKGRQTRGTKRWCQELVSTPRFLEQRQLKVSVSKPSREALRWKKNQAHRLINRKPKMPSKGVSHGSFVSYEVVSEGEVKLVM